MAANRDEFMHRPTAPLGPWVSDGHRGVLAGRDLRDGGTWMGVNTLTHRAAWLTNVREPASAQVARRSARSRGEWVLRWLTGDDGAPSMLEGLAPDVHGGFNLVTLAPQAGGWAVHWISNRLTPGQPGWRSQLLAPGIHTLSNAALNTPWPKSLRLQAHLRRALRVADDLPALQDQLLAALSDDRPAPDHRLPETGVGTVAERHLSAIRVNWPDHPDGPYGTRSSTVLTALARAPGNWEWHMLEQTHGHGLAPGLSRITGGAAGSGGAGPLP